MAEIRDNLFNSSPLRMVRPTMRYLTLISPMIPSGFRVEAIRKERIADRFKTVHDRSSCMILGDKQLQTCCVEINDAERR